jgi:hypothetical protein
MSLTSDVADYFNMNFTDDPYWSESSWFSWAIPEQDICGFFYNHFRPNMNCLLAGPAMWDRSMPNISGQNVWNFLFFDWQLMRTLPPGRYGVDYNKYNWKAEWSMGIELLKPLERYRLTYDNNGFKLDLIFNSIAPPHEIGAGPGLERAFRLHFEQPGRIEGYVELDGKRFDVACYSIRDGSHGPRFLEKTTPGGYTWSTADERTGWHVLARDENHSRDTVIVGGYLLRDGKMASLTKGIRRVIERTGPRPSKIEILAEDALGRQLHALGHEQVPAEFMLFPDRGQWWTLYRWEYDGFKDAIGEDQEYYGIHDFRKWHRAGSEAWERR